MVKKKIKKLKVKQIIISFDKEKEQYMGFSLLHLFDTYNVTVISIFSKIRWLDPFLSQWEGAGKRLFLEKLQLKYLW